MRLHRLCDTTRFKRYYNMWKGCTLESVQFSVLPTLQILFSRFRGLVHLDSKVWSVDTHTAGQRTSLGCNLSPLVTVSSLVQDGDTHCPHLPSRTDLPPSVGPLVSRQAPTSLYLVGKRIGWIPERVQLEKWETNLRQWLLMVERGLKMGMKR